MKRTSNKKGFTIVELVIVIAVIAILAGVMIPTFSGLVEKANESAAMQVASAAYREAYALALADDGAIGNNETEEAQGYTFVICKIGEKVIAVGTEDITKDPHVIVVDGVVGIHSVDVASCGCQNSEYKITKDTATTPATYVITASSGT